MEFIATTSDHVSTSSRQVLHNAFPFINVIFVYNFDFVVLNALVTGIFIFFLFIEVITSTTEVVTSKFVSHSQEV